MLRRVGTCRVCLVELPQAGKLVPACVTRAAAGMVVETQSPKVEDSIKSALRFGLAACCAPPSQPLCLDSCAAATPTHA